MNTDGGIRSSSVSFQSGERMQKKCDVSVLRLSLFPQFVCQKPAQSIRQDCDFSCLKVEILSHFPHLCMHTYPTNVIYMTQYIKL